MPGQWTKVTGRTGRLAVVLAAGGMLLASCVSDQQAVDMGLATACQGTTRYAPLEGQGDPLPGEAVARYLRGDRAEQCMGAKRDAGNRSQVIVLDCATREQITATVAQSMANPARNGPDFDLRAEADAQLMRLKLGLTDFAGLQQGLRDAGIATSVQSGQGADECMRAGAVAPVTN